MGVGRTCVEGGEETREKNAMRKTESLCGVEYEKCALWDGVRSMYNVRDGGKEEEEARLK